MNFWSFAKRLAIFAALALASGEPAMASPVSSELAFQLDQAESVRAVKRLENSQAQYIQYRLWDSVEQLYANDAEATFGERSVRGRAAIREQWQSLVGPLPEGPADKALSVQLVMTPVVTMAPDGNHARGRWHVLILSGAYGGRADWHGAIMENEYERSGGVWRISRVRYHPQFEGPYETGWTNVAEDLKIVPYHYTAEQAGNPIPATGPTATIQPVIDRAAAARRIGTLNAEDEVRNLQNIYGYYVDQKMWDDVGDLFEPDATLDVAGVGRWIGAQSIRRGLERDGPPNLREGEVNDRIQVNMTVDVMSGGDTAHARGLEFGMLGKNGADAYWTVSTFENDYAKRGGVWRIVRMRIYPELRTDYYEGWAKSWLDEPAPPARTEPDQPAPPLSGSQFPSFRALHPATGRAVEYPEAADPVSVEPPASSSGPPVAPVADVATGLKIAVGYDATENISSALGNWIDDFQWADMASLFTADGIRLSPGAGYYVGPERIRTIQEARYGGLRSPRPSVPMHLRVQPVIHFAEDANSALLRTRLLQFNSNFGRPGSMTAGIYNDAVSVENDVWKFNEVLIRHVWRSPGYSSGWARVLEDTGRTAAPSPDALLARYPPDRPLLDDGIAAFPKLGPRCFHYANPVSKRRSALAPEAGCRAPGGQL